MKESVFRPFGKQEEMGNGELNLKNTDALISIK